MNALNRPAAIPRKVSDEFRFAFGRVLGFGIVQYSGAGRVIFGKLS